MESSQPIYVEVGRSMEQVANRQSDDVRKCDTIKEAKDFARHSLTEEYRRANEFTEPMNYARVMVRDECRYDYFRKGSPTAAATSGPPALPEPKPAAAVAKPASRS
jgi:hypothetical protein